jgi:hypothetical protein
MLRSDAVLLLSQARIRNRAAGPGSPADLPPGARVRSKSSPASCGDLLDIHAARGRCDDRDTLGVAVDQQAKVQLTRDARAAFDVDAVDRQPSGPLWCVTRRLPSMPAAASTSSSERASFTPPALPRPPACTCALTTHSEPPSASAAAFASCALRATRPSGTGIPYSANNAFDWYSWRFKSVPGQRAERGIFHETPVPRKTAARPAGAYPL